MYTPLWHIPTVSQKLAEGQRSGPWWSCQDEIRIERSEVEVRLFRGISFQGTLHRLFKEDLIKKYPCSQCTSSCLLFMNRYQHTGLPLLRYLTSFPSYLEHTIQNESESCSRLITFRIEYYLHQGPCQLSKIRLLCSLLLRFVRFFFNLSLDCLTIVAAVSTCCRVPQSKLLR